MHDSLINTFYGALANRDGEVMAGCYHDDAVFEDPAFGELQVADARDMWRMLCASDTDLTLTHKILESGESTAKVNWVAEYTFTATGRKVTNDITANLRFADGLIIDHRDHFNLWKWSAQALGPVGMALGWSPPLKKKVRSTAHKALSKYQAANR